MLVELDLGHPTTGAALARAGAAGLPLDVRLVLPADGDAAPRALAEVARMLRDVPVVRLGVFDPHNPSVTDAAAVAALRAALADAASGFP